MPRRAAVRVEVPATSANLGPGYDSLGLALGLRDAVEVTGTWAEDAPEGITRPTVHVDIDGEGAGVLPTDDTHLVVRAMFATFDELAGQVDHLPEHLQLRCSNVIPHGRGLGSSSAAIVAGVAAARALVGAPDDTDAVVATAARIEGHPDNVAPCVLGGLTIAWSDGQDGPARAVDVDVHPAVRAVVAVPRTSLSTQTARGMLPDQVPHADAAFNVARSALLVEALTRRPDLLPEATQDRLHQGYRSTAMPDTAAVVAALRADGLAAVVSGAGPSVLVLGTTDAQPRVAAVAAGWDVRSLPVDRHGVTVDSGRTDDE